METRQGQKPLRLSPVPSHNSLETSRQLPPHPASYPQHPSPFSRPPEPQIHPHAHPLDQRSAGHNDHSPYESKGPRRPTSGPAHGYGQHPHATPPPAPPSHFPPYSGQRGPVQREPMVKRDPSDEPSQPQYRRTPPSPPLDHNVIPSAHHNGARPYHLPPFEHPPGPPGPPQYRDNSNPPPQSSMAAPEPYPAHIYGPPGLPSRDSYVSVSYSLVSTPRPPDVKRKAQRAAQACDSCRTLKAKCDEGRPWCSSCREKGMECRYRDPPPKQQDKISADMTVEVHRLEGLVKALGGDITRLCAPYDQRIANIESIQDEFLNAGQNNAVKFKDEGRESPPIPTPLPKNHRQLHALEVPPTQWNESTYSSTSAQFRQRDELASLQNGLSDEEDDPASLRYDVSDEDEGDPGPAKPPTIPINHTTGAARLLTEPAIQAMMKSLSDNSIYNEGKYPISHEAKRGLLRLFGRGEGTDATPGYDRETLVDHGSDSTPGDTNSDAPSPAPAGDEWGQVGGLTPPGNPPPDFLRGGINHEGMPDFSRETVLQLVKSYKDNMNNMHPIMVPARLDLLVENFLRHLLESQAKPKQIASLVYGHGGHGTGPVAGFVGGSRNPESTGNKRRRSPTHGEEQKISNFWDETKPGHPFRSIETALVLLVLALGKICLHKGRIPDVVPEKELDAPHSPVRTGHPPSQLQSSPSLSALPSPQDWPRSRSRHASTEGGYASRNRQSRQKNLDVIPGLAYFGFATDIIGNQLGGTNLSHVHANILAGLYHGQLARVMESHAYIYHACRGLQVLLRSKLDRFRGIKLENGLVKPKDNPLIFAFWTCLQLESDIIAELPCPQSGILTLEEDMPSPNLVAAVEIDKFNDLIIESYSAQLYLRKHLNSLHSMFYRPMSDSDRDAMFSSGVAGQNQQPRHFPTIDAAEQSLSYMDRIAPSMIWNVDEGVPATSILEARLRAKFYGAKVITYRPFLLKILQLNNREASSELPDLGVESEFRVTVEVPTIKNSVANAGEIDLKIIGYARKCILALVHSTTAFHKVVAEWGKDRLIVTNVWGTAHAQWGNLLTLQAAYMDKTLQPVVLDIIREENLRALLEKTIAFLSLVATRKSALLIDLEILEGIGRHTGLGPSQTPQGHNTSLGFKHNDK